MIAPAEVGVRAGFPRIERLILALGVHRRGARDDAVDIVGETLRPDRSLTDDTPDTLPAVLPDDTSELPAEDPRTVVTYVRRPNLFKDHSGSGFL
ncbi:hypothetical protein [Methylobacterium fujisawaense]|uniref:hypothetical protein n=1 Tax=Methylobacterium fujisawaense TaxID=107400 RepID=UPI00313EFC05